MSNDGFERPEPIGEPGSNKSGGGFRTVGIILLVLGVGMVAVCAGGAYWVAQNPAIREGLGAIAEAQNAPGAEELRAAGCDQAVILAPQVFLTMFAGLAESMEDLDDPEVAALLPEVAVVCNTTLNTSISCAQVAETYIAAVGTGGGTFMAQVASSGADPCQDVFDGSGNFVATFEDWVNQAEANGSGEGDEFDTEYGE